MAVIVLLCLLLFGYSRFCESQAIITTQPRDITVCTNEVAAFTCVVNRNGTSDEVMWQQIRMGGGVSKLITSVQGGKPFNITNTTSGDVLTSTLLITGATDNNTLGTSLYHCGVNGMISRNASLQFSPGKPGLTDSTITSTSFVVQWDGVDDVDLYFINWNSGGPYEERSTKRTSHTIRGLTPSTTYYVTVTAFDRCGRSTKSDVLMVTTNTFEPSSSVIPIIPTNMVSSMVDKLIVTTSAGTPKASSSSSSNSSGGAGGIIGGVVGGIIAVIVVIIIIVVLCWFCVYKKKDGADLSKETYVALQSPTGKGTFSESQYDTVDKPGAKVVPHQSTSGAQYAVSTKTASMASLNEPPPEYAYAAVDTKKYIAASVPHQTSDTGVQYAVSAKAAEAKDPHRYDEIRDEPGTSATGAEYAVSTEATGHQYDDVKDKSLTPQGINYAEIQHEPTPGVKVALDNDPVVHYTQIS